MRRRDGDAEEAGDAEESKGHGGQYSAARVQTLLEQNSDFVYAAAAFFVTLAVLILALTPTAIEVDAAGNPVRATHLKLNLPAGFRVKLSKIAHSVTDTLSRAEWAPRSELGVPVDGGSLLLPGAGAGGEAGVVGALGGGGVAAAGSTAAGGGEVLSSEIIEENRALRREVTELQGTVARLQASLQTTACLSITAAREGLCLPPLQASSAAAARASTRDQAVPRPAGYRRDHKRWAAAKDHWATQYVNLKSPKRRIGFEINTHNPDTEDIYISRAIHRRQIWDKPVFNVLKHVLVSQGLPPGRVLDIGGVPLSLPLFSPPPLLSPPLALPSHSPSLPPSRGPSPLRSSVPVRTLAPPSREMTEARQPTADTGAHTAHEGAANGAQSDAALRPIPNP